MISNIIELALEKNSEYYVKAFKKIECGEWYKASWNWSAFFFGYFWVVYRRLNSPLAVCYMFLYVFIQYCAYVFSSPLEFVFFALLINAVHYGFPGNFIYYKSVNSYLDGLSEDNDEKAEMIQKRFEPELYRYY